MTRAFFYDTWAFIALASTREAGHELAVEIDLSLENEGYRAVTSDYVLDETVTYLAADGGGKVAVAFLDQLLVRVLGGNVQLIEVGTVLRQAAYSIFRRIAPEERRFSFTDATSFAVMHELGIVNAFTADQHFHRAGRGVRPLVAHRGGRFRRVSL